MPASLPTNTPEFLESLKKNHPEVLSYEIPALAYNKSGTANGILIGGI
ncbi:MAG: hypothetical protein ACMUEM_00605 [Flavobacteriales bacterium AspAUS03]